LIGDVGGFARAGLLYGYPPESTAAIIGEGLGISGCAHALIDSDPEFAEFLGCGDPPGTARRWTEPPFLGSYEESLALDSDIDAQGVGS
jgi:hypothetical protein